MSENEIDVTLTYDQIYTTYSVVNLYCHGPICKLYAKVLTPEEIKENDKTAEKLMDIFLPFRNECRSRIDGWPQSKGAEVALAETARFHLSRDALISIVKALKITMMEAETSHYWHMKIILNLGPTEVSGCLHALESHLSIPVTMVVKPGELHSNAIPFTINESGDISVPEWFEEE